MDRMPAVSTSTEDYLEAILGLVAEKGAARVRDIAAALSVHKSTVSSALKGLAEKGLVHYSPYETATLTGLGEEIAQDVRRRHEVLGRFLTEILGIGDETAQANACRMEHILDADVLDQLSLLVDFGRENAAKGEDWIQQFQQYSKSKLRSRARHAARQSQARGGEPHQRPQGDARRLSTLDRLKPGKKATIVKVHSDGAIGRRMAEMGMIRGTAVEVVRIAPLGDPIEVKIKGYHLSIRKEEAAAITIELP